MGKRSFLIITTDDLSVDYDNCLFATSMKKARVVAERVAQKINNKHRIQRNIKYDYLQKIKNEDEWTTYDGKAVIKILDREPSKITVNK